LVARRGYPRGYGSNDSSHPSATIRDVVTWGYVLTVIDFDDLRRNARHGTRARYKAGCSCPACRDANAAYHRDLRERKRESRWIAPTIEPRVAVEDRESPADERQDDVAVTNEQLFATAPRLRARRGPFQLGRAERRTRPRMPPVSAGTRYIATSCDLRLACGHADRAAVPPGAVLGGWAIACTACSSAALTAVMRTVVAVLGPA
jgi:hypothetical protein